jgi:hypothetical protein
MWVKVLMSQSFRMSAPEAKNGFIGRRIVSSDTSRRNIRGKNVNIFKAGKIERSIGNRLKYRRADAKAVNSHYCVLMWETAI